MEEYIRSSSSSIVARKRSVILIYINSRLVATVIQKQPLVLVLQCQKHTYHYFSPTLFQVGPSFEYWAYFQPLLYYLSILLRLGYLFNPWFDWCTLP